ncbi:lipoprotein insertase outer membrane protein LolB [Pseudoxanthomonas sangjuensis]|uniref:lipoprotein insertase outer membrane protein LolB n=1 Tax=Pseudoxanthomonas sangjuensis TaxID=1503750 RepID=UPI0013916141|nr:lipoprotein insertase outer membrane protein LolB [Pseudoxanthomonas sangjuensis]KAF1706342.1 outer membrane lipoprotein LolB [Pseudoxanthomonas sangjuensis]
MNPKLFAIAVLALLLSACATQAVRQPAPPVDVAAAEARQAERENALYDANRWGFVGRIAVSNGRQGGNGRIEWVNDDEFLTVDVSAPITRQTWRLTAGENDSACIEGLEGGRRCGGDAAGLLRETTGWEIPFRGAYYWLRALRIPHEPPTGMAVEPATNLRYDERLRLVHLEQGGWAIDYQWPDRAATTPELPSRIDAVKGQAKIKLLVEQWVLR